jgi:hypothetical protein
MDALSILTGVGRLYLAPVGTTFTDLDAEPASPWRDLGDTQDGVDVEHSDKIETTMTDQRTGKVKATRTEESLLVKTKLAEATLENLADALGVEITDTPADTGVIGTREINLYRGATVAEYAVMYRGYSPYYDGPAQYQVPRMIFSKVDSLKFDKGKNAPIPVTFEALEDLDAATEAERFGKLIAQTADAE